MNTQTQTAETQALTANDIHVLTEQLNDAIKRAAEQGLRVCVCSEPLNHGFAYKL